MAAETRGVVRAAPTPLVSVGLPVYNGARFLPQALDSLLAQSLDDFELIVSDNASTDDTAAICADYARRDERIRYIRQNKNIGAPRNWSFVATVARGWYFKWASCNDRCPPQMLACCVATLESRPEAVLCYGRTCLVDEDTGEEYPYEGDVAIEDRCPSERFTHLLRALQLNNAQSGLIRLAALRQTGLDRPYPAGDLPLMAELALRGAFVLLPEVLLYRRMGVHTFSGGLVGQAHQEFYGGHSTGLVDALRRNRDYALGILRAPIGLREQGRTLRHWMHHLTWDLRNILLGAGAAQG